MNDDDERGGKVGNSVKPYDLSDLDATSCGKIVNAQRKKGKACRRQVFANREVAENTMRALREVGVRGQPSTCPQCGLIHLNETPTV